MSTQNQNVKAFAEQVAKNFGLDPKAFSDVSESSGSTEPIGEQEMASILTTVQAKLGISDNTKITPQLIEQFKKEVASELKKRNSELKVKDFESEVWAGLRKTPGTPADGLRTYDVNSSEESFSVSAK